MRWRTQNNLNTTSPLTAREVCQVPTDVALGTRVIEKACSQSWNEVYHGLMAFSVVVSGLLKPSRVTAQILSNFCVVGNMNRLSAC
ncbi:DUF7693 family protein [Pseudomonas reinekei]|uniref:DUF7693 family protein n=1 Tax=Pseudomonas reinekei TaxID=395598 RepID=UPI003CC5D328